ncbi:glycosyltransferase group 2 [alpha proteobacterium HIMB59]|nr:glycosyltransferase group 2 [alpha proteobacterium HIMB59]
MKRSQKLIDDVLVAIPIYNEEKYIGKLLNQLIKLFKHIIVIDNGSIDNSVNICKNFDITIIHHPINIGKAESMKTAAMYSQTLNYIKYIAYIDGDLQHDPFDLLEMYYYVVENNYDVVVGSRSFDKNMPLVRIIGNKLYSYLCLILFNLKIKDVQCGMRILKKEIMPKFDWDLSFGQHYFFDAKMTLSFKKLKLNYGQKNIKTIFHDKSKGMNFLQGIYLLLMIIYWRIFLK